jgi:hypothetical protein
LVGTDTPTTQERALLRKLAEEFGDGPTTANPQEDEGWVQQVPCRPTFSCWAGSPGKVMPPSAAAQIRPPAIILAPPRTPTSM